ncbi:MAG: hypothetical protein QM778_21745 [Myxococcales bacterium]
MKLRLLLALASSLAFVPIASSIGQAQDSGSPAQQVASAPPAASRASGVRVTVVVESEQAGIAQRLREALAHQSGVQVSGLEEALNEGSQAPRVLLTVSRGAQGSVNVVYWDSTGKVEALSAPLPAAEGGFELVASTLGSALLSRNLPRFNAQGDSGDCTSCEFKRLVADLRAHAMNMVPVRRRTFPISLDDF